MHDQTTEQIADEVRAVIVECLGLDIEPARIGIDQHLFLPEGEGGLELDSLGLLEILFEIGAKYRLLDLAEVELEDLTTVGAIAGHVRSLTAARN